MTARKENPLVSIVIPTYNSEKTLPLTLAAIRRQTYQNIEVIVVDSYSKDRTLEIAKKFKAKIVKTKGALLWARYLGHLHAKGWIEILLDSDQILEPAAIERGVEMIKQGYDMLILEEKSYKPSTLTQWLFYFDRKYVHEIKDLHPIHGVLLARMFKKQLLDKTFRSIRHRLPLKVMMKIVAQDHAIIYYEAWKHARKIGILSNAVYHIEPSSMKQLVKKFYRYGKTEGPLAKYYPELAKGKHTPRKANPFKPESMLSLALWILKAIPYLASKMT